MEVCSHGGMDPRTVLLKINGTRCNLACRYCSERPKQIGSRMSLDYIERFFQEIPEKAAIILHGGEPLLDVEYVEKILELFARTRKGVLGIQTNGVFDTRMIPLLSRFRERVFVGISLDGPAECNSSRRSLSGDQTFDRVDSTINELAREGILIKCIATVNKANIEKPHEFIQYFQSKSNIIQLRVNPCFFGGGSHSLNHSIHPLQFLSFLEEVSQEWINKFMFQKFRLDPTQSVAESLLSQRANHLRNCFGFVAVYSDFVCTLCDAMGADSFICKDWGILFDESNRHFKKKELVDPCVKCEDRQGCGIGCLAVFQHDAIRKDQYCRYRKNFSAFVKRLISETSFVAQPFEQRNTSAT